MRPSMTRYHDNRRRPSTVARDDMVHRAYEELRAELGGYADLVPRGYIYERLSGRTGLCTKTIAFILNHSIHIEPYEVKE